MTCHPHSLQHCQARQYQALWPVMATVDPCQMALRVRAALGLPPRVTVADVAFRAAAQGWERTQA
jgi:hypothetical protein